MNTASLMSIRPVGAAHRFWAILFAAAGIATLVAETDTRYHFDQWRTQQGLPQNTVKAILQTTDGYLWIATQGGLARFDGVRFRIFDQANTPALVSDSFISLAEDRKNRALWLATQTGIARFSNGRFDYLDLSKQRSPEKIWFICSRTKGGAWLACDTGLKYVAGDNLKVAAVEGVPPREMLRALLEDDDGSLWMGSRTGVDRFDPKTGKFESIWQLDPEKSDSGTSASRAQDGVTSLARGRDGAIWIGTGGHGLFKYQAGKVGPGDTALTNADSRIRLVHEDLEGVRWIVRSDGELRRICDGTPVSVDEADQVSGENVLCMHDDREGNVWIGTQFGGLKRMQRARLLTYSLRDGLSHRNTWSISAGGGDRTWIGTDSGLTLFENGSFNTLPVSSVPDEKKIKAVLEDRDGNVWAASRNAGLHIIRKGVSTAVPLGESAGRRQISSLYEDGSGAVWMGTSVGLYQFRSTRLERIFTTRDGLPSNDVRGMCETTQGEFWIATSGGGLARLHDGKFATYTTKDGLASDTVWNIHEDLDEKGVLWIGTNNGLTLMKNGRFTSFTRNEGLFDNVINDVLDDGKFLWIGCNRGIFRVSKAELMAAADNPTFPVKYVAYGESDGMLSSETNGGNQPAALRGRNGRLWFPTMRGVVSIDPGAALKNEVKPPVVIEEVTVDGVPKDPKLHASLKPGSGSVVEFQFTANSLSAPDKVLFNYRLEGYDKEWKRSVSRREATYANIPPGHYTFQVQACNNHGLWNTDGASFSFDIAPHFYQTRTFYAGATLFFALVTFGVHRFRVNVVRKIGRLERQHALEQERTRIAKEMHDDLGSSLTQIALNSELAGREFTDHPAASEHIRTISQTTREVFRAMDEIVWAVNPRHDTLDSLVAYIGRYAQGFLQPAGIRCRLDLPAELPPHNLTAEQRHNLFLAYKEGLNNVVKHAAASEVWVRLVLDDSQCVITIEDNGRGIDPRTARAGGNGLHNMKSRLDAIGGSFEIRSVAQQGTQIRMTVHLKHPKPLFPYG